MGTWHRNATMNESRFVVSHHCFPTLGLSLKAKKSVIYQCALPEFSIWVSLVFSAWHNSVRQHGCLFFSCMASKYHKGLHVNARQIAIPCPSCLSIIWMWPHVYPTQILRVSPMSSVHSMKVTACPGVSHGDKATFCLRLLESIFFYLGYVLSA